MKLSNALYRAQFRRDQALLEVAPYARRGTLVTLEWPDDTRTLEMGPNANTW